MNKYRVPVKLIFTGTVDVIAEDDGEAEDIALGNIGGILDHVGNNLRDDVITDWDISIHSDIERDEDEEVELIESWEVIEGNSHYTIQKRNDGMYAVFDEDDNIVDHSLTRDIQCAEKTMENLSEEFEDEEE